MNFLLNKIIFLFIIFVVHFQFIGEELNFQLSGYNYVFDTKTNILIKTKSQNTNNIYFIKKRFGEYKILIEKQLTSNKGFRIIITQTGSDKIIFSMFTKLIISDLFLKDNCLILTGSTFNDNKNECIIIDINTKQQIAIFEFIKKRDFLKIITFKNKLFLYNSSYSTSKVPNTITIINLTNYKIQNTILLKKTNLHFFGKGFLWNSYIYIPCISSNSKIYLCKFKTDGVFVSLNKFNLAIFNILKVKNDKIFYLGINKNNKIFFEIYNLEKNTLIFNKGL